jgi:hypothetical protein
MSGIFRRWFHHSGDASALAWREVRRWAEGAGHRFAIGRAEEGFVIETRAASAGCRIEWGPSQRHYIDGQELRVRADVGPANDLQMLVATRELLGQLERDVFEQYTEGTETRIDDATPEEMRWVVLYPQVPGKVLGALKTRFGLLSNRPRASTLWLEEGLAGPLAASAAWHDAAAAMVLVVQRGRFALRTAMPEPRLAVIEGAMVLGLAAAAAARRVAGEVLRGAVSSQRPSTWGAAAQRETSGS